MKFQEFFAETRADNGGHKHLPLGRVGDLRNAVDTEFRQLLSSYLGANNESVDDAIDALVGRYEEKWLLLRERGLSNSAAEIFLDRHCYPRPPGWHSVFFYPDSLLPRRKYLILLVALTLFFVLMR